MHINSVISGTGAYLPEKVVPNSHFLKNTFYKEKGVQLEKDSEAIVAKLEQISGIKERRYIEDDHDTVEIATLAGKRAIEDAGLSGEELDGIIVAHDVGNLVNDRTFTCTVPNLAAIVKERLKIENFKCSAFDIMFGCPGWLEGVILAHQRIACGKARHVLVIGVEVVSRRMDPHDLDSMLFGDGAGAMVISKEESEAKKGILNYETWSHCNNGEPNYITMGPSYNEAHEDGLFVKMQGRMVYRYAVSVVPELINHCLEQAKLPLSEVDKFVLHQANEKMLVAMGQRLFEHHGQNGDIAQMIPMNLQKTGNTSVATIPTLYDQILRGEHKGHAIEEGDLVVMASVGAGMHANCVLYRA